MSINYFRIFTDAMNHRADLIGKRDALEIEIGQVTQLVRATYPMLRPNEQAIVAKAMERIEEESPGLKAAVRIILGTAKGEWLTPPQLRDRIRDSGIPVDLGVNPLASLGTTLKRLPTSEVETTILENGQVAYRKRPTFGERVAAQGQRREFVQKLGEPDPFNRSGKKKTPGQQIADLKAIQERYEKK